MRQKLCALLYLSAMLSIITIFSSGEHAKAQGFCTHPGAYKHYGDFDGDGIRDTLCTDSVGQKWIAYGNGRLWSNLNTRWCSHEGSGIRVGDFNGDGRSDLICHDTAGRNWIVYANRTGNFGNFSSSWTAVSAFCTQDTEWYARDMNGDGRSDLVCVDLNWRKWYAPARPDGTLDFNAAIRL